MNHLNILKKIACCFLISLSFLSKAHAQACSTSNEVTITVVNDPTISISGATTICSGGTATLTATPAGGTGTCTIQWQSSLNGSTGWTNISGAIGTTYAPTSLTTTTYYQAIYSCTGLDCNLATSNVQAITVVPNLTVQTQPQPITECIGGTTSMSVVLTGGTGTGTVSYSWEQSATGSGGWSAATGATNSATYTPPSATAGTMYYRVIASATGNGCSSVTSSNAKVDIIPNLTVQTQPQPITECVGGTTSLSVALTGGTGTGTVSYSWEQSATGSSGWSAATDATNSATYTPPSATAGTMYYRVIASATGNGCSSVTSNNAQVDIIPDIVITAHPQNITECLDGTIALSVTTTGGIGTGYQWEVSTTGTSGWSAIVGATGASYTPPSTTDGTLYYRVVVSSAGNGCNPQTSNTATVVIVPKPSVTVTTPNQIVCIGAVLTLNATSSGGAGTCTLQWQDSTDGGSNWNPVLGATNNTYTTPPLGANTKYRATFTCNGNGCCN